MPSRSGPLSFLLNRLPNQNRFFRHVPDLFANPPPEPKAATPPPAAAPAFNRQAQSTQRPSGEREKLNQSVQQLAVCEGVIPCRIQYLPRRPALSSALLKFSIQEEYIDNQQETLK
jgi:hypothetical protein